ncbi:hypothetical protein ACFL4N_06965 [Thermodesulfobacteriota bacterium]
MKKALIVMGCILGGIVLLLMFMGVLIESGTLPDTVVRKWELVPPDARVQIENMVGVMEDETFKFFYTDHPFSYTANGYLVTDQRLIAYEKTHDDVIVMDCAYEDIEEIEIEEGTSFIEDTQLLVFPKDQEEGFKLLLSADESGDTLAIRYIENKLE